MTVNWHGWSVGEATLHIGHLPGRKSVALYVVDGSVLRPLAYFPTEELASEALQWLDRLAHVKETRSA